MIGVPSGRSLLDRRSVPLMVLTLALLVNFFWRAQLFTGNNLPLVVLLGLAFAWVWLLRGLGITGSLPLRFPAVLWPLALYVFSVVLSVFVHLDFDGRTIQLVLRTIVLMILTVLVANVAWSLATIERAMYLMVAGFALAALYGLADFVLYHRYFLNIFVGIDRKNASGYYFMSIIPFTVFMLPSPRLSRRARQLLLAAFVLCLAAMILTLARSAAVGLAAGLAAAFVLYVRRVRLWWVVLLVLLVAASVYFAPASAKYRFSRTFDFQQRAGWSNSSRLILLKAGLRMAKDNPWFGVGIGRFDESLDAYITPDEKKLLLLEDYQSSHNQYIQAQNEGGVLGVVALVSLVGGVLWGLHRRLKQPRLPQRYLFIAFAAYWWSQAANFFVEFQLARELFWFMLGLTAALLQLTPLAAAGEPGGRVPPPASDIIDD